MFTAPNTVRSRWPITKAASLLVHGALLAWLIWGHPPKFLVPYAVQAGNGGTSMTLLYWPPGPDTTAGKKAEVGQRKRPLTFKSRVKQRALPSRVMASEDTPTPELNDAGDAHSSAAARSATRAGSPHGSVLNGPLFGQEVRPALPIRSSDPVVTSADLAGGLEGDVIVEITIDEKGAIVEKVVLRSLAPAVDLKVLAALEQWRFRPATRDGYPISSKQDVYYHFPQRR